MAVSLSYSNITIRGITYKKGSSFVCYASNSGNGGSEGNGGAAAALTTGTTYYVYCKASGDDVTYPYAVSTTSGGAVKGWYKENVFPYATYSVKYNANGGSGAPSTQTKTYGTNLTLSSTKPTRTGYTFKGWGTSASATSVAYAAGATYSTNAAITLYAIWTANTYTISFADTSGDTTVSNIPSSVTKTYGVTLTLPKTVPTRTNYEFKGWTATKGGSTATYLAADCAAGTATFTTNATTTLYAVWELKYLPPTISSLKVIRCDGDGTANDFGVYAKATFNWECCQLLGTNNVSSITVSYALVDSSTWTSKTITMSGTSGTGMSVVVGGALSIESKYQIKVTVVDTLKSDGSGTTYKTAVIPAAIFPIDFLAGGKGVSILKPASVEGFTVGSNTMIGDKVGYLDGKTGVYLNKAGYMHLQRSSSDGHPYVGFLIDDEAEACDGLIRLNSSTGYMQFVNAGAYAFDNSVYINNRQYGVNKVLWSGVFYMNASQSITFSESAAAQPNGIVFVFSEYNTDTSAARDQGFWCRFVPKTTISSHSGKFFQFVEPSWAGSGRLFVKGMWLSPTGASGHACSVYDTDVFCGVDCVLRYVIGV